MVSLLETMGSSLSRRASSAGSGVQTMPQVLRMMKAIFSGVHSEAATIRSPSFSRSSSSVTTTISPLAKASTASVTAWAIAPSFGKRNSRKSLGLTAPPVARAKRSALSRDSQAVSSLHSAVMEAGDIPTRRANSAREIFSRVSQSSSFMAST